MITDLLYIFTAINLCLYLYITITFAKKWNISRAHKSFFFFALFSLLWIVDTLLENTVKEFQYYNLIVHLNYSLAALVAVFMSSFSINFPYNKTFSLKKESLILLPCFIVSILAFTDLFVKPGSLRMINTHLIGYYFYISILLIYFIIIPTVILFRKLIRETGIPKKQIQYILVFYLFGITILLVQSIITNIYGVLSTSIDLFLTDTSILFSAMISYSILRYRFMDIRIIIQKGLIYGISLIATLAIYTYLALFLKDSIEKSWSLTPGITAAILVGLVALGFPLLKMSVDRAVNTLFKGKKSIDLAVKELREQVSQKKDLDALVELVGNSISQYLGVEWAKFFIISHRDHTFVYEGDGETERIQPSNELIRYFEKYPEALVRDEIPHLIEEQDEKFEKEMLQKAEKEMKKRNASLALPFRTEDELYAVVFLGHRQEGSAYSVQDVEYLVQLREQVNFTLASAVLYRDAMERVKLLAQAET